MPSSPAANITPYSYETEEETLPDMSGPLATRTTRKQKPRRGTSLVIRNVIVDGRRTSIRLEPEMWRSLQDICKRERCTVHDIATMVAAERATGSLTAALRVFVMAYYRAAATEDGHNTAGHGSGVVLTPLFNMLAKRSVAERQRDSARY